mgnify:CR=1 FL=1
MDGCALGRPTYRLCARGVVGRAMADRHGHNHTSACAAASLQYHTYRSTFVLASLCLVALLRSPPHTRADTHIHTRSHTHTRTRSPLSRPRRWPRCDWWTSTTSGACPRPWAAPRCRTACSGGASTPGTCYEPMSQERRQAGALSRERRRAAGLGRVRVEAIVEAERCCASELWREDEYSRGTCACALEGDGTGAGHS